MITSPLYICLTAFIHNTGMLEIFGTTKKCIPQLSSIEISSVHGVKLCGDGFDIEETNDIVIYSRNGDI